jgi:hypothetical protein
MNQKLIDKIKSIGSMVKLRTLFGRDVITNFYKKNTEIKNYIDNLSKGNFTIKTDPPYRKLIKVNFKVVDFNIEKEDGYVDIYLYIDLLMSKNFSEDERIFIAEWVQSYNQDDPVDVVTNDPYFNDKMVWVRIIKVNGHRVDTPNFVYGFPNDIHLFDLLDIPYENFN